jgi:hypothetical protein
MPVGVRGWCSCQSVYTHLGWVGGGVVFMCLWGRGDIVCCVCGSDEGDASNPIVMCDGCPWAYHQHCRNIPASESTPVCVYPQCLRRWLMVCECLCVCVSVLVDADGLWFCSSKCRVNLATLQCGTPHRAHAHSCTREHAQRESEKLG